MRVNYATAPWVPYTTWAGGVGHAVDLIRTLPSKGKNGKLHSGPLSLVTKQIDIQPLPISFGQLVKVLLPIEKRRQISLAPKLIPQAVMGYYLCAAENTSNSYVYSFETNTAVLAGKVEPVPMEFTFKNTIISTTSMSDPFGYKLPSGHINKYLLTTQKQVTVKQVIDIGVHIDTNTEERYGVVKVTLHTSNINIWVLLQTYLKGRKDRTHIHRNLLNQFLDNHFQHRQNDYHPIFVRSDVLLADKKTERISSTTWPALIISYDSKHILPIGCALFDDTRPTICDIHDCKIADVIKLNNLTSISSVEQFCDIPPIPKRIIDILTFPEPYRSKWIASVKREVDGVVVDRKGITPCTRKYMLDTVQSDPTSYILNCLPVFKIKLDETYKTRFTMDGRLERIIMQKLLGSKSPYLIKQTSPSVNPETLHLFLWLTIQFPKHLTATKQVDYAQAYLNSKRTDKNTVFVRLPQGIEIDGERQGILNIFFYGELGAGLHWFINLTESIMTVGTDLTTPFRQNEADPTLFHHFSSIFIVLILVNVDDLILHVIGNAPHTANDYMHRIIKLLGGKYKLTVQENINNFLGLNLTWDTDRTWVKVTMGNKIDELSELFKLSSLNMVDTPLPLDFNSEQLPEIHTN